MRTLERSVETRNTTTGRAGASAPSENTDADIVVSSATASPEEQLRGLLGAAAAMEDADDGEITRLRSAARRTTQQLVTAGVLPAALAVDDTDPPVVVARLLSRAWRHTARSSI